MPPETEYGLPSISSSPLVGGYIPNRARIVVVLPEPLLPRKPKVSPRLTVNERLLMTLVLPNVITKSLMVIISDILFMILHPRLSRIGLERHRIGFGGGVMYIVKNTR